MPFVVLIFRSVFVVVVLIVVAAADAFASL